MWGGRPQPGPGAPQRGGCSPAGSARGRGAGRGPERRAGAPGGEQGPSPVGCAVPGALPAGLCCLRRVCPAARGCAHARLPLVPEPGAPALLQVVSGEKPPAAGKIHLTSCGPSGEGGSSTPSSVPRGLHPPWPSLWEPPLLHTHGCRGLQQVLTGLRPSRGAFPTWVPCAHQVPPLHLPMGTQGSARQGAPHHAAGGTGGSGAIRSTGPWRWCSMAVSVTASPLPPGPRSPPAPAVHGAVPPALLITILFGAATAAVI